MLQNNNSYSLNTRITSYLSDNSQTNSYQPNNFQPNQASWPPNFNAVANDSDVEMHRNISFNEVEDGDDLDQKVQDYYEIFQT